MGKKLPLKLPHPRNIYREKPNIKELALQFPEFQVFAIQGLDGRVTMNFKDKKALCALTKVLLKKDFQLSVDIPPDRLVPTVPLRLNYLLWIEDLLEILPSKLKSSEVYGIDIGTGASCIYALLAARKNHYHMLATEADETSYEYASRNVLSNNLKNLVTVKKVSEDTFLCGVLDSDKVYDFCMCNPPFFSVQDDNGSFERGAVEIKSKNRTGHRLPPKNAQTGSLVELTVPGGEVAFIDNIIKDSIQLKDKIRIYTTMVGHKSNVEKLINTLVQSDSIGLKNECVTVTPFYQGNVTRWGIAWTFIDDVEFPSVEDERLLQRNKKLSKPPVEHILKNITLDDAIARLRFLLDRIQIMKRIVGKKSNEYALEISSYEATWKNQRKRRREEQRRMTDEIKRTKLDTSLNNITSETVGICSLLDKNHASCNISTSGDVTVGKHECIAEQFSDSVVSSDFHNSNIVLPDSGVSNSSEIAESVLSKSGRPLILKALILLKQDCISNNNKNDIIMQLSATGGTDGWNSLHQVLTYLKNHWGRDL